MPDPTRVEGAGDAEGRSDSTTAEAPVRWSGAAPVPVTPPTRSRWSRRRAPADDEDDWGATPAVDPWADQDTPWSPLLMPAMEPLPATRIDPPPATPKTRIDPPVTPKTRIDPPVATPPAALPGGPPAPKRPRWGRRQQVTAPPVNRGPVQTRPYSQPPPPWHPTTARPPAPPVSSRPPVPAAPRGRRRRARKVVVLILLTGVLGGVAAYYAWPTARQYPVSAVLPGQVRDLSLSDDTASRQAADRLAQQLRDSNGGGHDVFAGVYADGNGKKVTIFGTTGLRMTPGQDVKAELDHLTSDFDITEVEAFDLGEAGAHERCGIGRSGGRGVVVCAWADHGSLATVLLTRRNVTESARLVADLRSEVLSGP